MVQKVFQSKKKRLKMGKLERGDDDFDSADDPDSSQTGEEKWKTEWTPKHLCISDRSRRLLMPPFIVRADCRECLPAFEERLRAALEMSVEEWEEGKVSRSFCILFFWKIMYDWILH